VKEARPYKNHRKKIRGRKPRTFYFRKTGFVHSRSGTYCASLLSYFAMKFLPDIRHCVCWVLAEIWAPDSSHKIRNKFFIHHCPGWKEGSFACESVWFFFLGEYSSVWPEICRVLSQIQWRFLRGISWENHVRRIFQKFCAKPRLSSSKTCEILPYFLQFFSGSVLRWKKFTQVLSYVGCTQVRRHVHKQITERRYG